MKNRRGHGTSDERTDPRGFALPVAIFALVIIGVLVTGGFFVARQESRIGVASRNASEAFYIAERGLAQVMGDWHAPPWIDMALYRDSTITGTVDGGEWSVTITKTGEQTFFMDATGEVTEGGLLSGATRRVGVMTKLVIPDITPPAAITTQGPLTVGGNSTLDGHDADPAEYTADMCDPSTPANKPGIMTNDASQVDADESNVSGDPQSTVEDPSINDETFTVFGEITYQDLVEMASHTLQPQTFDNATVNGPSKVTANGRCATSNEYNWGTPLDPTHVCATYHPVIHIESDVTATSYFQGGGGPGSEVQGQGILLVDGNMEVSGRFVWNGIIIVQGSFVASGTGNKVFGGVYARNAQLTPEEISGNAQINASTCAVDRALRYNTSVSRARPLADRSWVDLSAISP